uniref:Uncharacterized protein n=1 Tax=Lepeophtheirus salmonis TaxID=72036 RepID=A0A0K2TG71_LEPSM
MCILQSFSLSNVMTEKASQELGRVFLGALSSLC